MFGYLFGYHYILNKETGEIHNRYSTTCEHSISLMAKHNKKYITKRKVLKLIKKEKYDGCAHCMKEYHTK